MFSIQKFGGITRYFCELIKNLPSGNQFSLSLIFSDNHYLEENFRLFRKINILPDKNFKGKYFIRNNLIGINAFYSKYCISLNNFDLFHPTFYDNYFFKPLKKPYIITVHDLIVFKYKDTFYKSEPVISQMEYVIKNANRIIAVSKNTKKDLMEIMNINSDKIDIIYHGYEKQRSGNKTDSADKYILYVGHRDRHKNFKTFALAISILFSREKELKLICVGDSFGNDEMALLAKLKIVNRTSTRKVNDNELNDLYTNALVFVYPSLYEGFGMPILEAFANNCPVCLSNASCFPEIAGEAAVYFEPESPDSILSAIERVIYNKSLAEKLVQAGQIRLKNYSWTKTAQETLNSYKRAI